MQDIKDIILEIRKTCRYLGKELFPKRSAKLFHKLALIYKNEDHSSGDKLLIPSYLSNVYVFKSLNKKIIFIQTATLLNAAIVRHPDNVEEIKHDLKQYCFDLLKAANARNVEVDLVEYSKVIARDIELMRRNVEKELQRIPVIPDDISDFEFTRLKREKIVAIRKLQNAISEDYTKIMKKLSKSSEKIMGKPPCKYALVGLGSLSKKEITPYSDFEHVIVLEDSIENLTNDEQEKMKDYFRWFTVIFQMVLINLGETNISRVHIPGLRSKNPREFYDAVTPVGVCFDGMMPNACKFPLGGQNIELIQSASKMARFIGTDEGIKNHLADMLMTPCFVAGSQTVFQQFEEKIVLEKEEINMKKFFDSLDDQIEKNKQLCNIDILQRKKDVNVKAIIYRSSTIFISAVGKKNLVENCCSFEIVEKLIDVGYFSSALGFDLLFAVAVSCETRLRVYMRRKSQDDIFDKHEIQEGFVNEIVGIKSLLEYFLIIFSFQKHIHDLNNISKPGISLNISFCYHLNKYKYAVEYGKTLLDQKGSIFPKIRSKFNCDEKELAFLYYGFGLCKHELGQYQEAIIDFLSTLEMQKTMKFRRGKMSNVAILHHRIALCKYELGQYQEAITSFTSSLKTQKQIAHLGSSHDVAVDHHKIGLCQYKLCQYKKAIVDFTLSLEMYGIVHKSDIDTESNVANQYYWIGLCKYKLDQYNEALVDFTSSLEVYEQMDDSGKEIDIAIQYYWIGRCKYESGQPEEALADLTSSLEIDKLIDDPIKSSDIADIDHWIRLCRQVLGKYDEPHVGFHSLFEILEPVKLHRHKKSIVAGGHYKIGLGKYDLGQYQEAIVNFTISLEVQQQISRNSISRNVADRRYWIGLCKFELCQYEEAFDDFILSLQIQNRVYNPNKKSDIAVLYYRIGRCRYRLSEYKKALIDFISSLKSLQEINEPLENSDITDADHWIGLCKKELGKYDFPSSLEIGNQVEGPEYHFIEDLDYDLNFDDL